MAKKGQIFKKHSDEFKQYIVNLRLKQGFSKNQLCKLYKLSPENVIKWTRRYLAGEQLSMKRGRPPKVIQSTEEKTLMEKLIAENKRLKTEIAYKDEVLKFLEKREELKKKNDSESSNN
jgi:transposase-like protein